MRENKLSQMTYSFEEHMHNYEQSKLSYIFKIQLNIYKYATAVATNYDGLN